MSSADLLLILLNILIVILIAIAVYLLIILIELRENLRRGARILTQITGVLGFIEEKVVRTGTNATIYLGLMKEFFDLVVGLSGKLRKEKKGVEK